MLEWKEICDRLALFRNRGTLYARMIMMYIFSWQAWHGLLVSKIQELQEICCRNTGDTGKNKGTKRGIVSQAICPLLPSIRDVLTPAKCPPFCVLRNEGSAMQGTHIERCIK